MTADVHALHRVSKCSTENMGKVSIRSPRMKSDDHIGIACVPEQKQDLLRIESDRDIVLSDELAEDPTYPACKVSSNRWNVRTATTLTEIICRPQPIFARHGESL
jgi:hypothetical protein